jgi:hypothetical protein
MKKLKMALASFGALCLFLTPVLGTSGLVVAQENPLVDGICNGVELEDKDCEEGDLAGVIKTIINVFSWIVGAVSVIMIIYGGFRYITSAGNDANVTAAKNTILYAIIGLVIVALAQIIVRFVMNQLD